MRPNVGVLTQTNCVSGVQSRLLWQQRELHCEQRICELASPESTLNSRTSHLEIIHLEGMSSRRELYSAVIVACHAAEACRVSTEVKVAAPGHKRASGANTGLKCGVRISARIDCFCGGSTWALTGFLVMVKWSMAASLIWPGSTALAGAEVAPP